MQKEIALVMWMVIVICCYGLLYVVIYRVMDVVMGGYIGLYVVIEGYGLLYVVI